MPPDKSLKDKPFLSVVMPVHDGAQWIGATLQSLAAGPVDGLEIIIIDSSQTDSTAAIVSTYSDRLPLQLLRRSDLTPWQTKTNLGVEMATADHLCILHQDDLWLPHRSASIRRWIAAVPAAALHLAPTRLIDRHGRLIGNWTCPLPAEERLDPTFFLSRLLVQNFISVPAPVFSRSAWIECGGMDESLWYTPDWDIWLKLAAAGPVVYHDAPTTAFRIHGNSLTVTGARKADEFRAQMEIVLDRHLTRLAPRQRRQVERAALASIRINVSLAAASDGGIAPLMRAARALVALGPAGISRYLRDSRLVERVVPRLRAKLSGAF